MSLAPPAETLRFLAFDYSASSALRFWGFRKHLRMCSQVTPVLCRVVVIMSIRDPAIPLPPCSNRPLFAAFCPACLRALQDPPRQTFEPHGCNHHISTRAHTGRGDRNRAPLHVTLPSYIARSYDMWQAASHQKLPVRVSGPSEIAGACAHLGSRHITIHFLVVSPDVVPIALAPTSRRTTRWAVASLGCFLRTRPSPSNLFRQSTKPAVRPGCLIVVWTNDVSRQLGGRCAYFVDIVLVTRRSPDVYGRSDHCLFPIAQHRDDCVISRLRFLPDVLP